jgi:hypothetical protein
MCRLNFYNQLWGRWWSLMDFQRPFGTLKIKIDDKMLGR